MLLDPLQIKHGRCAVTDRHKIAGGKTQHMGRAVGFDDGIFESAKDAFFLAVDKKCERVAVCTEIVRRNSFTQVRTLFITDDAANLRMMREKFNAPL